MPLTDAAIRAAKPAEKPRKLFDGEGMYLEVSPSGGKWWRLKYRTDGKEKRLSLGTYPQVTLLEARRRRDEARRALEQGLDPSVERQRKKAVLSGNLETTFESVARLWHESWKRTRTEKHANQVLRRMELDVFPKIGNRQIATIKAPDLVAVAKAVEKRGAHDLARRAIQISGQVFRYAVGHGLAEHNPARDIEPNDVLQPVVERNYNRVSQERLPALLKAINRYEGHERTRLAMHLMSLTFLRTSELIGARWEEFDWEKKRWVVPAKRMKMPTQHIIPLARQTLEVLEALKRAGTGETLLFPGNLDHEKPISNNTILFAIYRMGFKGEMTGHGFRGVASTALHELGLEHAHIELQLAHQPRDRVSAAYNYAQHLPQRTKMMQFWADHLDAVRGEPIKFFCELPKEY